MKDVQDSQENQIQSESQLIQDNLKRSLRIQRVILQQAANRIGAYFIHRLQLITLAEFEGREIDTNNLSENEKIFQKNINNILNTYRGGAQLQQTDTSELLITAQIQEDIPIYLQQSDGQQISLNKNDIYCSYASDVMPLILHNQAILLE